MLRFPTNRLCLNVDQMDSRRLIGSATSDYFGNGSRRLTLLTADWSEAVTEGDLQTVEVLLDREDGADPCARVNAKDRDSVLTGSVLHLAVQQGDLRNRAITPAHRGCC